ncbi:hypothetical protein G3I20_24700 [Streptomyces sp. SID8111]|uniref:hypothetical protein n=1 Tax=Streptomyces sp. SID8111 TaxID=2706100 RepID=UPI0013C269AA|nr:hypothetical protein [Streptomyces sp. SID8111]NEC29695.1 hypothetical protein [Streptomyces sp. SID8111]
MTEHAQTTDPADRTTDLAEAVEPADAVAPADAVEAAAVPAAPARVPFRQRRRLRAALRWTAVVTVFAALGAGTAYGITRMERTDVPGLATESDGRWDYPRITKPPLPAGARPYDSEDPASGHAADLRALLLPAPAGATEDKALRGKDGWLSTEDFTAVFAEKKDRTEAGQLMTDHGLRHAAARGWTTEDGTRTRIYLLRFATAEVGDAVFGKFVAYGSPSYALTGAEHVQYDDDHPSAADPRGVSRYSYDEVKPRGAEHVRQAYVRAGDVVALIVQSRKGTAAALPFRQTVTLQSQLLS